MCGAYCYSGVGVVEILLGVVEFVVEDFVIVKGDVHSSYGLPCVW